jgi:hypothetical protein
MAASSQRVAPRFAEPGRPTKYQASHATQAFKLALLGATDEEIANCWGISIPTFYLWLKKHPPLSKALRKGKEDADANVAHSLYKKANGYDRRTFKVFKDKDGVTEVPFTEHVPPDTASAIFWLKNRQRGKWRDKHELEHTGADGGPIQNSQVVAIADLAPEQREQLRAMLLGLKKPATITDVEAEEVEDEE